MSKIKLAGKSISEILKRIKELRQIREQLKIKRGLALVLKVLNHGIIEQVQEMNKLYLLKNNLKKGAHFNPTE